MLKNGGMPSGDVITLVGGDSGDAFVEIDALAAKFQVDAPSFGRRFDIKPTHRRVDIRLRFCCLFFGELV